MPLPLARLAAHWRRTALRWVPRRAACSLAVGTALVLAATTALAEETDEDGARPAEILTVVATRTERRVREVAATVSVKTDEQLEEELARDIADLVRFEPGVSVSGTGSRFGLSGVSIRGIGGNRVLTLIDGVRVPEEFSFGPFLGARRDYVDIDSLRHAEIARGPVSALWGSDALGGVVALTTKDPRDRLAEEDTFAAAFKGGYSSADDSTVATLDLAGERGALAGMVLYTRRASHETDNAGGAGGLGPARERPDPQDGRVDNLAAKVVFAPSEAHRVTVGLDSYSSEIATDIRSDYGIVVYGATVNRRGADDARTRTRGSLHYRYLGDLAVADSLDLTLYRQNGLTEQRTDEDRISPRRAPQTRYRDSRYEQRISGLALQLGKRFATGHLRHTLTWGVDHFVTRNAGLRDGATFDANGGPVREFPPLPTRDFPRTDVTMSALFVQDEIALLDGALLLSPGLRYDRFDADAEADAIYLSGNPGALAPVDYSDAEVSAKVGAVYHVTDRVSAYAGYSEGFRAPPYDDVNVGFSNFIAGYKTLPAPDLESERSRGVEVGVRFAGEGGEFHWTLFRNDYENFIEALVFAPSFRASRGIDPADGLATFQSVNRESVRIQGSELSAAARLGRGVSARLAIAYADGEDRGADAPLSATPPLSAVLGLGYDAPDGRWGGDVIWSLAQGKDAADVAATDLRPPTAGYGVVDLLAHLDVGTRTCLNFGLFNLTDKAYVRWADTVAIVADATGRFTQPGINGSVTLRVEF